MRAFLQEFQLEAEDNLNLLEEGLMKLEHLQDPEVVRRMFTAAHTIKGSAGMMGLQDIQTLTHALEDVLDALRKKPRALTEQQASVLLQVVDEVRAMCLTAGEAQSRPQPLNHWLKVLEHWQDTPAEPATRQPETHAETASTSSSVQAKHVLIHDPSMTARMHQAWLLLEAGFSVQFAHAPQDLLTTHADLFVIGQSTDPATVQVLTELSQRQTSGVIVTVHDAAQAAPTPFLQVALEKQSIPEHSELVQTALALLEEQA